MVTDKQNPAHWKPQALKAKAAFDFIATAPNELTVRTNDEILIAPKHVQDEMKLTNTGWVYAVSNGKFGLVPMNHVVLVNNNVNSTSERIVPVPRMPLKSNLKRVSFGENQIVSTDELDNLRKKEFNGTVKQNESSFQSKKSDDVDKIKKEELVETIKPKEVSDESKNSEELCNNLNTESS